MPGTCVAKSTTPAHRTTHEQNLRKTTTWVCLHDIVPYVRYPIILHTRVVLFCVFVSTNATQSLGKLHTMCGYHLDMSVTHTHVDINIIYVVYIPFAYLLRYMYKIHTEPHHVHPLCTIPTSFLVRYIVTARVSHKKVIYVLALYTCVTQRIRFNPLTCARLR